MQSEKKDTTHCTEQTSLKGVADGYSPVKLQVSTFNIYTQQLSQKLRHWITHDPASVTPLTFYCIFFNPGRKIFTYSSLSLLFQNSPPSPEPWPLPVWFIALRNNAQAPNHPSLVRSMGKMLCSYFSKFSKSTSALNLSLWETERTDNLSHKS